MGIMPTPIEAPDVLIGHVGDHFLEFGIFPEEMLAGIGAALGLVGLVLAVHGFFHPFLEKSLGVFRQKGIPLGTPDDLDDVPARTAEICFQFLNDLAIPANRSVQTLEITVDHEDEVIQLLAACKTNGTQRFGFVHLAIATVTPGLATCRTEDAAIFKVFHEASLVDRHDRPKPHRNRRELPEIGHQPRMRIRAQALALSFNFRTEEIQLLLAQTPFKERSGVDSRCSMPLEVDQISTKILACRPEKMIEADIVKGCRRGETRNMSAVFR